MKRIALTKGYETLVDDEVFGIVARHKWHAAIKTYPNHKYVYAARTVTISPNKQKTVYMHRIITTTSDDMHVDHINGDTLDNRKSNLRICTPEENRRNSRKHAPASSTYKGVKWSADKELWRATCGSNRTHIGFFSDEKEAAKAYDEFAKEQWGEFAFLNFPGTRS